MADDEGPGNDQTSDEEGKVEIAGEGDEDVLSVKSSKVLQGEDDQYKGVWKGDYNGEYGEGGPYILYAGEEEIPELPPLWEEAEYEPSEAAVSAASSFTSEVEETEEERAARLEREHQIELIKTKLVERVSLRRRNIYLHRKLVEHFKKRRMDHVLREDSKSFELETKYLKRLHAFQNFKDKQESEIYELNSSTEKFRLQTDELEHTLSDTLDKFIQRQKDLSLALVSTKTGKKLNERTVDRLLRRQLRKCIEKGKLRLKYIKLKNLIEEKEKQLKEMENFGDGLHIMDYEQLKIDNQNFTDKIEEKEEELQKLRVKTHGTIQNLAQVREKAYAIEGDFEIMEAKYNEVESDFNKTREQVGRARKKRDELRDEYALLKRQSGLLTNTRLLRDFEFSIGEKERVKEILEDMRNFLKEKKKKQSELGLIAHKQHKEQHRERLKV